MSTKTRQTVLDYMMNERPSNEAFAGFLEALRRHDAAVRSEGFEWAREKAARCVEAAPATHNRNDHAERIRALKDETP